MESSSPGDQGLSAGPTHTQSAPGAIPLQRHLPPPYLPALRAVGNESVHLEYRTQSVQLRTCSGGKTAQCTQDFPILELESPDLGTPNG